MLWKRILVTIISCALLLGGMAGPAPAAPETPPENAGNKPALETTADSAVLMENSTGRVLFAKEADKELPMASVTKIMTLLLAVEAVEQGKVKLTDRVVTSENAWEMGGSQIYLEPGEEMSLEEMLIAVAVGSANDASVAVAEHVLGSEEAFVQAMNDRAKQLGLHHTHFVNPTGLPAKGHYTSARDMAVIMRECLKNPLFRRISSIYEYDLRGGEFKLWNTNKLLKWFSGADAGKTGWTNEAKYCLASSAERDGLRLIAVVLGTPEPRSHFRESIKLFKYGFARYQAVKLAARGATVKQLPVGKGVVDKLAVVPAAPVSVVVPRGEQKGFAMRLELPARVTAPVVKGQKVGECVVVKNGREALRVPLVAGHDVPRAGLGRQIQRMFTRLYGG